MTESPIDPSIPFSVLLVHPIQEFIWYPCDQQLLLIMVRSLDVPFLIRLDLWTTGRVELD